MAELRINDPDNFMYNAAEHMCAILDTLEAVEQVVNELAILGYDGVIKVFHGEEGAALLDVDGSEHGWLGKFRRTMQNMSDLFLPILKRVETAVLEGQYGIAIPAHSETERDEILEILRKHDGSLIAYFGKFTITGYW